MPASSSQQLDAPMTLTGLFPDSDDEHDGQKQATFETQTLQVAGRITLRIRQFDFHSHNANQVWPGTFRLLDYLLLSSSSDKNANHYGSVLELGTATGVVAISLLLAWRAQQQQQQQHEVDDTTAPLLTSLVTSDVQDGDDAVAQNLMINYALNGIEERDRPRHIRHTWGTGWHQCCDQAGLHGPPPCFDTIVASDILLYVNAYPALVQTLQEIDFGIMSMSWNRRMKESAQFFAMAQDAGMVWQHVGQCIYTIRKNGRPGNRVS